jgi:hypothetical protein
MRQPRKRGDGLPDPLDEGLSEECGALIAPVDGGFEPLNIRRRWVHVPQLLSPGWEVMESGTVYPYRTLKLTWPSPRSA